MRLAWQHLSWTRPLRTDSNTTPDGSIEVSPTEHTEISPEQLERAGRLCAFLGVTERSALAACAADVAQTGDAMFAQLMTELQTAR